MATEIEGITWYEGAIDAEPYREPDAMTRRLSDHMDRCAVCTHGDPMACDRAAAIVGVKPRRHATP
jgi:hypothetical protein